EREADVVEVADLRYNKRTDAPVRIVLAVQQDSGIERPEQMPENAKISTEYPNITRRYFERLRIPVRIFFSYGATEAKDMMDGIVELTETGETLTKNNWRIIDVLMESTARLIANKDAWNDPTKRKAIEEIKTLLLGVLEARGRVLLSMNVRADRLESVVRALPALKRPTISRLYGDGEEYYAVETVVSKKEVNVLIPKLKELGAEDILEIDILKIVR
ncbi:MAG TPA: ATP phosphoribosyltransferase, partial [Methanomicrobia archaeon]|nr:ATP phosphoribosyltransferase [Methanomicrobia archaeon]HEX58797.1 ATP phosphoribosyltransferase [Methanomicrobia archaeon]